MICPSRSYPAYKCSGVPWLGDVPEHWEVRRTKTLLAERSQKGFPDEPLLAATQTKGVVRKEHYDNRTVLALKDLHLLKLVRVGDFCHQSSIIPGRDRVRTSARYHQSSLHCPVRE